MSLFWLYEFEYIQLTKGNISTAFHSMGKDDLKRKEFLHASRSSSEMRVKYYVSLIQMITRIILKMCIESALCPRYHIGYRDMGVS